MKKQSKRITRVKNILIPLKVNETMILSKVGHGHSYGITVKPDTIIINDICGAFYNFLTFY